jgi:hypothetical protein
MAKKLITEFVRARDVVMFFKGDSYTVTVSPEMLAAGWSGGQGVMWTQGINDERTVTFSDGRYGGFLVWGSDEIADRHTGQTGNQVTYRFATFFTGGSLFSTTTYERYTYASRLAPPLVPIVYQPNDILYLSLRGWWTNEDEATLSGAPYAPDFFTGFVAQVPKESNNFFLGVQSGL